MYLHVGWATCTHLHCKMCWAAIRIQCLLHWYAQASTNSSTSLLPHWLWNLYYIARNFQGRKLSQIGEKYDFAEKTFRDCSLVPCQRTPCLPISCRKLSQIATKLWNLRKTFSFESFLLYKYTSCTPQLLHNLWEKIENTFTYTM